MPLTSSGKKALKHYCTTATNSGGNPPKFNIAEAVKLTPAQREAVSAALTRAWGRAYICPFGLDIKPRHAYESRIIKDQYPISDLILWFELGCSEGATVHSEPAGGRTCLVYEGWTQYDQRFDIRVLISADTHGNVHIFDVIPKGLEPIKQKKAAPSADP